MAGDRGLHFPRRIATNFNAMLCRSQQHHATHFRQPQRGSYIQRGEDALHGQHVRSKLVDQPTEPRMNFLQGRSLAFLAPVGGDFQCSIMQQPALSPVTFHDSVTRWAGCGRVKSQNAHPALRCCSFMRMCRRVHRHDFTANGSLSLPLCERIVSRVPILRTTRAHVNASASASQTAQK